MADASGLSDFLESGWRLDGTDGSGRRLRLLIGEADVTASYLGVTVGRHPALCQRVIDDPGVSRRHFRIGRAATGPFIEDVNSLNGTSVDGVLLTPFEPVALRGGQTLTLGHVQLQVARIGEQPGTDDGDLPGPQDDPTPRLEPGPRP